MGGGNHQPTTMPTRPNYLHSITLAPPTKPCWVPRGLNHPPEDLSVLIPARNNQRCQPKYYRSCCLSIEVSMVATHGTIILNITKNKCQGGNSDPTKETFFTPTPSTPNYPPDMINNSYTILNIAHFLWYCIINNVYNKPSTFNIHQKLH